MKQYFRLICPRRDVQLLGTLNGGQSFRWTLIKDQKTEKWCGIFADKLWILQQYDDYIAYEVYEKDSNLRDEAFYNTLLADYFQLDLNLNEYFTEWSNKDPIFSKAATQFYGIRILKQDLIENIFSFICSTNNNITRITGMVEKLAKFFGEKICDIDGKSYYSFPTPLTLSQEGVEQILRKQGFGYRSKYINESAKTIVNNGGDKWLDDLKSLPYQEARLKLMSLTGIGPKVADCIALMSLGHLQAIPVDTHVYQIARNFYLPKLPKRKTVTTQVYQEIGDHFRELYGPLAGWAHTVLFCADLKKFQN